MSDLQVPLQESTESSIRFHLPDPDGEVTRVDQKGFHYRGQLIEDAGEAHRLLVEFLNQSMSTPSTPRWWATDEELLHEACTTDLVYSKGIGDGFANPFTTDTDITVEVLAFARAILARWGNQ